MRVVVSGGGTGGHIFPALAVVEQLGRLDSGGDVLYIGSSQGMEADLVPKRGIAYQGVTARKLRKVVSLSTVGVAFSLWKGYREARAYLKAFRAEAVVGTGGYVAAATVLAGAKLGLPTLIVAPDMVPGRTNRLLSRSAKTICLCFEETIPQYPAGKAVVTGLPLRAGVVLPESVGAAEARCGLPGMAADRFTVVVIGGSQGARAVNNVVLEAAPNLLASGVQILHQTGARNFDDAQKTAQTRGLLDDAGYVPMAFLDETQVPLALRAADLLVCRGGISTLSEGLANGLPMFVIPLPTAYADHQTANAAALARAGAALSLAETGLTASKLTAEIFALRDDAARRKRMATASHSLGRPDAAQTVAELVLSLQ